MMKNPSIEGELIKVFISYTHDSHIHDSRVLEVSRRMREAGFDSDIDQYHANQSWPAWMEERLEWADYIIVICTATYLRRWQNDEEPGVGLGAQWESFLTRQILYESPGRNHKVVPVVFEESDLANIPRPLRDVTRVVLGADLGRFEHLRKRLLNLAPAEMPPIMTSLAPIALAKGFFDRSPMAAQSDSDQSSSGDFDHNQLGLREEMENIIPNLFPVIFPKYINTAKIALKRDVSFVDRFGEISLTINPNSKPPSNFLMEYGTVYTFEEHSSPIWAELFRTGALKEKGRFLASQWADSPVFAEKTRFIKLLNRCLHEVCQNNGTSFEITHSKDMHCYLFAAHAGKRKGWIRAMAIKIAAQRTVFKAILDKLSSDPNAIQHWQHEAFRHKFLRFGDEWYLNLVPFWAFTCDDTSSPSRWQKKSSSNMRKPERNRAVLGHVLFWASILCKEADLLHKKEGFQILRPVSIPVSPSIKDSDWSGIARDDERKQLENDMDILL